MRAEEEQSSGPALHSQSGWFDREVDWLRAGLSRTRWIAVTVLGALFLDRLALLHVEAPVVDGRVCAEDYLELPAAARRRGLSRSHERRRGRRRRGRRAVRAGRVRVGLRVAVCARVRADACAARVRRLRGVRDEAVVECSSPSALELGRSRRLPCGARGRSGG